MKNAQFVIIMHDNNDLWHLIRGARVLGERFFSIFLLAASLISILLALKLDQTINWAWVWIFAPGWLAYPTYILLDILPSSSEEKALRKRDDFRITLLKEATK